MHGLYGYSLGAACYTQDSFHVLIQAKGKAAMGEVLEFKRAKFGVGDLVHHTRFDYRGVVVDVDPTFQSTDEWYEQVARSRPPKDKPWYHVLVHGSDHMTYVAERHLEADESGEPVQHPLLELYFSRLENGRYVPEETLSH